MKRPRRPLYVKILLWFFLTLLVLGAALFGLFNLQFRVAPDSPLAGLYGSRFGALTMLAARDLSAAPPERAEETLRGWAENAGLTLYFYSMDGERLAGPPEPLPPKIAAGLADAARDFRPPPPRGGPPDRRRRHERPGGPQFVGRTSHPTRYWMVAPTFLAPPGGGPPRPAMLLAASDSMTGHGFFIDATPLLLLVGAAIALAALLWLPLVHSITKPLAEASQAAGRIAEGRFDVRLDERRADEIGALGAAINEMAARLGDYVRGQKRFLGDVAHELASPIARIQLGLAILEQRVDEASKERVREVGEEAREMSRLVEELLSFTRAELRETKASSPPVKLAPIVQRAIDREAADGVTIRSEVSDDATALGDSDLLTRAVANVLRNAVRYAGRAGPIVVSAGRDGERLALEIRDAGAGVPEEALGRLFEPFYRPQAARERETGGVGLGLAIVKSCVAACGGTVSAHNLPPAGFVVRITLRAPAD